MTSRLPNSVISGGRSIAASTSPPNSDLNRRALLSLGAAASIVPAFSEVADSKTSPKAIVQRPNEAGPYDVVISGGRVIDPETGLDAVRHVGLKKERIAAISTSPLEGTTVLQAEDHVVAPGFIDLHAHGQQLPASWMQAFDGVTTALELESGLLPISKFYADIAHEGRPINYGASVAWTYARIAVKEELEPDGTLQWFSNAFSRKNWQNTLATPAELEKILAIIETGLKDGGIGIGINAGYAPGHGRKEYYELARLAKKYDVPTFTHVRYANMLEPLSSFEALEELVALAASTGAHMHVCHLNSNSLRDIPLCVDLLMGAQKRGLPITVEAYSYGAQSTAIGAEMYRGENWLARFGTTDASAMEMNGKSMTQAEITAMQQIAPGTPVVFHFLRPDQSVDDQKLLDMSVLYPGGAIASDAMPWIIDNSTLVEGNVWPMPDNAFAHPRSAGCFARFFAQWVRERNSISLIEAVRKTSLIPAQILENSVPQMRRKGRLQVGSDADLVVFNPATFQDRATFVAPNQPSIGVRHLLVNGTPVIQEAARIASALPGVAIRRVIT